MIHIKKFVLLKCMVLLLSFLFVQGDISVYADSADYRARFARAKQDYMAGLFDQVVDSLERIHRIGQLKGDLKPEDKDFLVRVFLLLAAAYEMRGDFSQARSNYEKVKEFGEITEIPGVDLSGLIEYQRIIQNKDLPPRQDEKKVLEKYSKKKKKKFPWVLVTGIAIVAIAAVFLLMKKKTETVSMDPNYDTDVMGIEWIDVPAGEFLMGDNFNEGLNNELPVHQVYLDAYRVSKYEITFEQYDLFCEATGRELKDDRGWGRGNMPIIYVSWDEADTFCSWLAEKTGKNIRLLTEAQWEKAARGSDQRRFPWGNEQPDCTRTNFSTCLSRTAAVGSYPSGISPYGIHDMAGNVTEWCSDWYVPDYYSTSPAENPPGPESGVLKITRGGGWINTASRIRSACRLTEDPVEPGAYIGFRICWNTM
jgi:formylglycine-generating enzyme required for sulfatase activity